MTIIIICLQYYILNTVSTGRRNVVSVCRYLCTYIHVRAYTWVRIQLVLEEVEHDAWWSFALAARLMRNSVTVTVSVDDRIDCHMKHHSILCNSKVHFDTIVLDSSKTSTGCSNVIITILLPMALKRNDKDKGLNHRNDVYSVSPTGSNRLY